MGRSVCFFIYPFTNLSKTDSVRLPEFFQVVKQSKAMLGSRFCAVKPIFASVDSSRVCNLSLGGCLLIWTETFHHLSDEIHFI